MQPFHTMLQLHPYTAAYSSASYTQTTLPGHCGLAMPVAGAPRQSLIVATESTWQASILTWSEDAGSPNVCSLLALTHTAALCSGYTVNAIKYYK